MEECIAIAYFSDRCDIFGQTDSMIEVQSFIVLYVAEHFALAEIHKNRIFFYFEAVDLQEDVALAAFFAIFLIMHY